jgi:hypothetical protein
MSPDYSLHGISSDNKNIYALVYSELYISDNKGSTWVSAQNGLPKKKYTFQIAAKDNTILAGQWDGIYRKNEFGAWSRSENGGLPDSIPITEMSVYKNIIIAASSAWSAQN